MSSVADPHHIDADPDMDPEYQFDVDQDSADHFDADPDPTVLQKKQFRFWLCIRGDILIRKGMV